ncbi:MAG TPA: hypothetical protein VNU23_04515 [Candidatus Cybelea sp.]|jgi:hypothetical protein|nr:hypothetical protein [Candidatus Cybelea sp.]
MLLATILLLYPFPQSEDTVKAVVERSASVSLDADKDSSLSKELPSAPEPKIKNDTEIAADSNPAAVMPLAAAEPIAPGSAPLTVRPGKPAFNPEDASERQKKVWYALAFASSGAAGFDAWSSRRAISGGYGTESNPLLRPFAHSNGLYAAMQVSPLLLDYVGRKMMTSQHPLLRRMWWLPQSAGTGMSLFAGVHNVGVVPSN